VVIMMDNTELFAVVLTGSGLVFVLLALTACLRSLFYRRLIWLNRASKALARHADDLERFLAEDSAPADSKALYIGFSDVVTDQVTALSLADALSGARSGLLTIGDQTLALGAAWEELRGDQPNLANAYRHAIASGMGAAPPVRPQIADEPRLAADRVTANPETEVIVAA
jgi:hypothetical protein